MTTDQDRPMINILIRGQSIEISSHAKRLLQELELSYAEYVQAKMAQEDSAGRLRVAEASVRKSLDDLRDSLLNDDPGSGDLWAGLEAGQHAIYRQSPP